MNSDCIFLNLQNSQRIFIFYLYFRRKCLV